MTELRFITAIGTPLHDDDSLHRPGLEKHLEDQAVNGIHSILVGGTMGLMQMLADDVWKGLVEQSITMGAGRFEILVGTGDTSHARTRQRIEFLNTLKGIDGVVILAPYFLLLKQTELVEYFASLADTSTYPVFLYDLPGVTKTHLELSTVQQLARHPNIRGIKCSGELHDTRQLMDSVDAGFRVILARPELVDMTIRYGVREHLDGAFAMYPDWIAEMRRCTEACRWEEAAGIQRNMNALRSLVLRVGLWGGFTAIMNARGIPGRFAPYPIRLLDESDRLSLLESEPVRELLNTDACTAQ